MRKTTKLDDDVPKKVRRYIVLGYTVQWIARRLGVSQKYVLNQKKRFEL